MTTEQMKEVSKANNAFALALHHELRARSDNLIYSPYSITLAMALVHAGAVGQTRDEIGEALGFADMGEDVHGGLSKINKQMGMPEFSDRASREKFDDADETILQLEIASGLWRQRGIDFEPAYLDLVGRMYDVRPAEVDFPGAPGDACRMINEWARDKTRGLISKIVEEQELHPLMCLYLANAIHFKAPWDQEFKRNLTRPEDFHCLDGATARVDMMYRQDHLPYWESDELQAVSLPYRQTGFRFVVVMPRPGLFETVERQVDAKQFNRFLIQDGMYCRRNVRLGLPRFRMNMDTGLRHVLGSLGVRSLFSDAADLSAMSPVPSLRLDKIEHSAVICVDEAGTEAVAITRSFMFKGIPEGREPVEMIVNRPFLFYVVDGPTNTVLFAGRMLQP